MSSDPVNLRPSTAPLRFDSSMVDYGCGPAILSL